MNNRVRLLAVLFIFLMLFLYWTPPQPAVVEPHTAKPTDSKPAKATPPNAEPTEDQAKKPDRKPHACPETFYTAADIAAHKKCDFGRGKYDLWLVINENVYDVSEWAPFHPGGMLICHARGIDGTSLYKHSHQDWVTKTELPKWCIGKLQSGEISKLPTSVPEDDS